MVFARLSFVAAGLLCALLWGFAAATADQGSDCPSSWPAGDYDDFFTDAENRRWFVIRATDGNGYTLVRAYPATDNGYVANSPDEICYLMVRRPGDTEDAAEPERVVFAKEREEDNPPSMAASVPPKSAPADYTRHFVDEAIRRYETDGLDATLAYYNSQQSVDGQWYVFIIDENDLVIGHPDPSRRGLDVKGPVGTDINGYNFGPEMLSATEEGKWVSYVYRNPGSQAIGAGEFELKNVWVARRDGLLFASGWYIGADEFTERLVSAAVDSFRQGGLPAVRAFFANPGDILAGMETAIDYYNTADTLEGIWFAYIEDPSGNIVARSSSLEDRPDVQGLLRAEQLDFTEGGVWVTAESLRVYVVAYDGYVFAFGWIRDE